MRFDPRDVRNAPPRLRDAIMENAAAIYEETMRTKAIIDDPAAMEAVEILRSRGYSHEEIRAGFHSLHLQEEHRRWRERELEARLAFPNVPYDPPVSPDESRTEETPE